MPCSPGAPIEDGRFLGNLERFAVDTITRSLVKSVKRGSFSVKTPRQLKGGVLLAKTLTRLSISHLLVMNTLLVAEVDVTGPGTQEGGSSSASESDHWRAVLAVKALCTSIGKPSRGNIGE